MKEVSIPAPERRVREYPHQLSGGMRQRVVIAMALACDPKLLIADEPTTALDVTIQAGILDLMRDIRERLGTAIILITHNLGVVADIADRVIVMYAGRKVEEAPVDELYASPQHPYTVGLLGAFVGRVLSGSCVVHAVDGASFSIGSGEMLGLVGASGSGKSTVANGIMRLTRPTSGTIKLKGNDITFLSRTALRPLRRDMHM